MPIPFLPAEEKERAEEFLRRYNSGVLTKIPLEDLVMYVASVWREGRQSERRANVKLANDEAIRAANARAKEVSETGLEFQRGQRVQAENIATLIGGRSALTLDEEAQEHGELRRSKQASRPGGTDERI